jgi:hypothetical protein
VKTILMKTAVTYVTCVVLAGCSSHDPSVSSASSARLSGVACEEGACAEPLCARAAENEVATVTCAAGLVISKIVFASYGRASGSCGAHTVGACESGDSHRIVEAACLGKPSCSVAAENAVFGDPCVTEEKSLTIDAECSSPTQPPAPAPGASSAGEDVGPYGHDARAYTLTFRDEFEGGSLDADKWADHIWYDTAKATPDYGVMDGALKIWPERNAAGGFDERVLTTAGHFHQTYGYFEMEAKLPVGAGLWPAFWLLNSDDPDRGEPEIDIMEAYSGDSSGYWSTGDLHPIRYEATYFQNGANFPGLEASRSLATPDLSAEFHKYAVSWKADSISFYFDGQLLSSAPVSMSKRAYILLDMQYGGASGPPDATTPTGPSNAFEVKYVRAWAEN